MTDGYKSGLLIAFLWLLTIGLSFGSGLLAWDWIKPIGFFSFIFFIAVWSVLTRLAHFIVFSIVLAILEDI